MYYIVRKFRAPTSTCKTLQDMIFSSDRQNVMHMSPPCINSVKKCYRTVRKWEMFY